MPGLLDITRQSKTVRLSGGQELDLVGLSARDLAGLMKRFPELQALLGGRHVAAAAEDPRASMVDAYPEAIAAAIALSFVLGAASSDRVHHETGNGHTKPVMQPSADQEEAVACWSGVDQWLALAVVLELSLPPAIARPLVAALADPDANVAGLPGRAPDTTSSPASTS